MLKKRQQISTKLVALFLFFLIAISTIIVFTNRASYSKYATVSTQIPIYQRNSYSSSSISSSNTSCTNSSKGCGTILVYNPNSIPTTIADLSIGTIPNYFVGWKVVFCERINNTRYRVTTISAGNEKKSTATKIPARGIAIVLYQKYFSMLKDIHIGTEITLSGDIVPISSDALAYDGTQKGTATFRYQKYTDDSTSEPTIEQIETIDTADDIKLNLYNYADGINDMYDNDHSNPGFQNSSVTRNGNGVRYFDTRYISPAYEASFSGYAVDAPNTTSGVTITSGCLDGDGGYDSYSFDHPANINCIYYTGVATEKINKPMRYTVERFLTKKKDEHGNDVLNQDGKPIYEYPVVGTNGTVLSYLFPKEDDPTALAIADNNTVTRVNQNRLTGLFSYNKYDATYSYDSMYNHAQFNQDDNVYEVYNMPTTPVYNIYPFGNFLPFNDINNSTLVKNINYAWYRNQATEASQLTDPLASGSAATNLVDSLNAYRDYFSTSTEFNNTKWTWEDLLSRSISKGASPTNNDYDLTHQYITNNNLRMLNATEKKDYFFGFTMEFDFFQSTGGEITREDGTPDSMTFYFAGDDDTLVFIDGELVLDIGGIHRQTGGMINFQNGTVTYYMPNREDGGMSTVAYKTEFFRDTVDENTGAIIPGVISDQSKLNANGTFKDDSKHTLKFFYMERGSGSGYLKLSFNMPLKTKIDLDVYKVDDNEDDPQPLNGADIAVCRATDINCVSPINRKTTTGNGLAHFETNSLNDRIQKDTLYYVLEKEAPEGYIRDSSKHYFYFSESDIFSKTDVLQDYPNDFGSLIRIPYYADREIKGEITIVNETGKSNLNIKKIDKDSREPLSGAEFSLYSDSSCNESSLIATQGTDVNGIYTFENLEWNRTYYLKETRAPHLYKAYNDEIYTITIDGYGNITFKNHSNNDIPHDGDINYIIENERAAKKFEFIKVAHEDHSVGLPNAMFKLYRINDTCVNDTTVLNSIYDENLDSTIADCFEVTLNEEDEEEFYSASDGRVTMNLLYNSTYRLIEEVPPGGRVKPGGQWNITISETGVIADDAIQAIVGTSLPPAFAKENGEYILPNIEVFDIPSTGSFGTILYTAFGVALMGGAYLIIKRAHKKKKTGSKEKIKQDSKKDKKIKKDKVQEMKSVEEKVKNEKNDDKK